MAGIVMSVSGTATSQGMGGTSAPAASVVVSGELVAFPPDGGMRVSLGNDTVPVTGAVSATISGTPTVAVAGTVPVSGTISANVVGTVPVIAYPPDGGAEVRVTNNVRLDGPSDVTITGQSGPLDSNIVNPYVSVGTGPGAPKVDATVTGALGGPVVTSVSGAVDVTNSVVGLLNGTIVNLTPQAMAALTGARICTDYPIGNISFNSLHTFANYAGQQTASITFHNFGATTDYIACWRSTQTDGGPPPSCDLDAGVANVPLHSGDTWTVDGLSNDHRLRCRPCTHAGPPSGGTALAGGAISACTPTP